MPDPVRAVPKCRGASCKYGAKEKSSVQLNRHSDNVSDQNLKTQRSLQTIATMLATTEANVQNIQVLGLHLKWEIEIHIQRHANRTGNQAFLAVQEKRKHRRLISKRTCRACPDPNMPPAVGWISRNLRTAI